MKAIDNQSQCDTLNSYCKNCDNLYGIKTTRFLKITWHFANWPPFILWI